MTPATVWYSHPLGGYLAIRGDDTARVWRGPHGDYRWHVTRAGAVERMTSALPTVLRIGAEVAQFDTAWLRRPIACEAGEHTVVMLDRDGLERALCGDGCADADQARIAATIALEALEAM